MRVISKKSSRSEPTTVAAETGTAGTPRKWLSYVYIKHKTTDSRQIRSLLSKYPDIENKTERGSVLTFKLMFYHT